MRRFLTILTFLLIVVSNIHGQWRQIARHQAWVDSAYAKPANMTDEQLIRECGAIVAYKLQEPKALALLRHASSKVPELARYADFVNSQKLDTLQHNHVGALEAIYNYASKRWPGSDLANWCRIEFYINLGNIIDISAKWDAFIEEQKQQLQAEYTQNRKRLLCLSRAANFVVKNVNQTFDDPRAYPEAFEIESEALQCTPIFEKQADPLRAEIYYWLANMKSILTNDFLAGMEASAREWPYGNRVRMTGQHALYPCNSEMYFENALNIATACYTDGHPFVRAITQGLNSFRLNANGQSEDLLAAVKADYDYLRNYFPETAMERNSQLALWCIIQIQLGIKPAEDLYLKDAITRLMFCLGHKSPVFRQHLLQTAMTKIFAGQEIDYWAAEADATMDNVIEDDRDYLDQTLNYMVSMYEPYFAIDPTEATEKITEIANEYVECHRPSMLSILVGQKLAECYATNLSNYTQARNMMSIATLDLMTMLSDGYFDSPLLWDDSYRDALISKNIKDLEDEGKYSRIDRLADICSILSYKKDPRAQFARHELLRQKADMEFDVGRYADGLATLRRAAESAVTPGQKVLAWSNLANEALREGDSRAYTDSLATLAYACFLQNNSGEITSMDLEPLSTYYTLTGNMNRAAELGERQLEIYREESGDAITVEYVYMRVGLANTYRAMGRLNDARRMLDENTDILNMAFGMNPSPTLLDLMWNEYELLRDEYGQNNINLYHRLNDLMSATSTLYQRSGGDKFIYYNYLSRVMAELIYFIPVSGFIKANDHAYEAFPNARKAYEVAVQTCEEMVSSFPSYDPDYANNPAYREMVNILSVQYGYDFIRKDLEKSMKMMDELMRSERDMNNKFSEAVNLAWSCHYHGMEKECGRYMKLAEEYLSKASNPEAAMKESFAGLKMEVSISSGNYREALELARREYRREKAILDGNFQLMTTAEQQGYMDAHGDPAAPLANLLEYLPDEISAETYDAVIYRTGMQLRSQKETRDVIECSTDPKVKYMLDSLNVIKLQLTTLNRQSGAPGNTQAQRDSISKLIIDCNHRSNRVEQQLLALTASQRRGTIADVSWTQIRDRLAAREAAVEFVYSKRHVMALVVRPGCKKPEAVTLCMSDSLMAELSKGKSPRTRAMRLYGNGNTSLYSLLWQPLEHALGDASTIYISLPGVLSNLAFNAIQTPDGKTLFDCYDLRQLTTTGQLVFDRQDHPEGKMAIVGDILYAPDQTPEPLAAAKTRGDDESEFTDDTDSRGIPKNHFRHLPFTAEEIDTIASLFPSEGIDSLRRHNATEQHVRELISEKPAILHLATHGFYIAPGKNVSDIPFFKTNGDGSMQRSGIALADAEQAWKGLVGNNSAVDGILTAAEVAELDLKDTQLVVLSACETALGDYSFEGVYGLQRGLKQAGAKTLLVSLWSVDDHSTSFFMKEFYQRMRQGEPSRQAWRNAISTVRGKYPQPYHWAPFILLD